VSWVDNVAVLNVTIEHNFTGTMQNYSATGNVGDMYYYNYSNIPAGIFAWKIFANDSYSNYNSTDQYSYTVNQNTTTTQLYLNGSEANLTTIFNGGFNATAVTNTVNVSIYRNGTLVNNSTGIDFDIFYFENLGVGHYNITAVNLGDDNYTDSNATWWLNITKAESQVNLLLNETDDNLSINQTEYVNISGYLVNGEADGQITLYQNGSQIDQGTSPLHQALQYNNLGIVNITVVYSGSNNYSASNETWWIKVNESFGYLNSTMPDPLKCAMHSQHLH